MWVMNDSCSLASCGAERSMNGLMGRPRLASSSPWKKIYHVHRSVKVLNALDNGLEREHLRRHLPHYPNTNLWIQHAGKYSD